MALRTKIVLLASGSVALLALAMFLVLSNLANQQMDLAVRQNMEAANTVVGRFVEEHGRKLLNEAKLIESFTITRSSIQDGNTAIVQDLAESWRKLLGTDAMLVLGQRGQVLALDKRSPSSSSPRQNGFAATNALDGKPVFRLIEDGGRLRITAGVPVRIGGVPWGAICVSEDVDATVVKAVSTQVGTRVAFQVGGHYIGFDGRLDSEGHALGSTPAEVRVEGEPYLALGGSLPPQLAPSSVRIVTYRPVEELVGPYRAFQRALLMTMLAALLIAVVTAIHFARGLTRPLDGIVLAARTVCSGAWPEPFGSTRQDEIGVLQAAFDQMTESVRGAQDRLMSLLDTDLLTELANHRSFQERLTKEVVRSNSSRQPLSVLLVDVDRFHAFNDEHGHAQGDNLLRAIADSLNEEVPELGLAGRFGGEEFAVMLPHADLDAAESIAEAVRKRISHDLSVRFGTLVSVSIGCAQLPAEGGSASGLMLSAELAMAQAKELGRNRVCRFDSVASDSAESGSDEFQSFLADGSYATIQALAAAVDAKDPYTRGHSQRVAEYAADLATEIGLHAEEVELIRITGTLHDVGKIGVPDAILQKSGRLSDEERQIMETHPVLGEVIVRKAPALADTLPGVRGHHERWDGKGYPDGLSEESIPLMARVLALADTFDAMTSDRPYRKGMDVEVALAEIELNAGTQFDPALVPAFVQMMGMRFGRKAA